jgi:ribulose-5-phosphate 4-epimerase/fuculose-1-phosphate aldolase
MTEAELRVEICRVGRSLYERGLAHGTAGNVSARLPGGRGLLITPTDACLGLLSPDALSRIDAHGRQVVGAPASKTLALHRRIYGLDAGIGCVLHTHSTHLVALSLTGVWRPDAVLPPITPYFVMKVGRVPLIPYLRPGDPVVAEAIALAHAAAPMRAVLCERLGPFAWHATPAAAMALLEEMEETARLWLTCQPRPAPLDETQIDELRHTFGAHW